MPKILTVDDDAAIVNLLSRILKREGYEVVTATTGRECIAAVKRERPGLILLDVNMPGMDGGEVMRILQEDPSTRDVPVVFLTGIITEEEAGRPDASGSSYISKYSDPRELVRRVRGILPSDPSARVPAAGLAARHKVLVVDDNPDIRALLERFLLKLGHTPLLASSAEEALEKVASDDPPIVLMDIKLPGTDGLTALKTIREKSPSTRVIMITGVGDENNASEALRLGASEFIVKPIDLEYLALSLHTATLP